MLKITLAEEEKLTPELMIWWNGEGAAHVLAHNGYALLLERTNGSISLAELARTGHDDEASRIICSVVLQPRDIRVLHGDIHHFRSEEHTSELQSLMRISYAVYCLKKKQILHKHQSSYYI